MHNTFHGQITPPSSPPPTARNGQHASRCPPTPESRIGIFLGQSLELKGILGRGAYGVVYSAFDHLSQTWYAVKTLSKTNANGEPLDRRQREFHAREIQLHYAASAHPNILSMLKIVDDPECTYVVMEYCPEGDLFSNITELGRYVGNDDLVRQAFLQIVNAVEHCHRLGIYHRDLKPENILVSHSGSQVLLADFGLATTAVESDDHGCGSTFYMSPECLDQSARSASYRCAPNDIWSLGVILVNLSCGRNPWRQASAEDSTYKAFTRNRDFLKTILPLSDEVNEILRMIFERKPENRITIAELKQRIMKCVHFSAPPQPAFTPPTSPMSPMSPPVEGFELLSDDGSIMSGEGSLTGSCSTVSDSDSESSRSESGSGSGYGSREGSPELADGGCFEACPNHNINNRDAPQHVQRPAIQASVRQHGAYVLPVQEFQGHPWNPPAKPNPWMQQCGNPYDPPFEPFPAVHVHVHCHPAPAVYPSYPALQSSYHIQHNQYMTHCW